MNPKKILLAIDHNESSLRAVKYLGHICGSSPGFIVTILHIIEMPEEDFFRTQAERDEFLEHERERSWVLLKQARDELAGQGLNPEHLHLEMEVRGCDSMASCILEKVRLGSAPWWSAAGACPSPRNSCSVPYLKRPLIWPGNARSGSCTDERSPGPFYHPAHRPGADPVECGLPAGRGV